MSGDSSHHDSDSQTPLSAKETLINQAWQGNLPTYSTTLPQKDKLDNTDQTSRSNETFERRRVRISTSIASYPPSAVPLGRDKTLIADKPPVGQSSTTPAPQSPSLAPPQQSYNSAQLPFWPAPMSRLSVNPIYPTGSQSFPPDQQSLPHSTFIHQPQPTYSIPTNWNYNMFDPSQWHRPNPLTSVPQLIPPSTYRVIPPANFPQIPPSGNPTPYRPAPNASNLVARNPRKNINAFVANDPFNRHSRDKNHLPDLKTFDDIPTETSLPDPQSRFHPSTRMELNQHGNINQHGAHSFMAPFRGYTTPFDAGINRQTRQTRPISPESVHRVLRQPPTPEIPFIPPSLSDLSSLQLREGVGFRASCLSCIGDCLSCMGNSCLWPFSRPRLEADQRPAHVLDGTSAESNEGFVTIAITFVVATLPTQVYLHFLLRLPALYFSRVARIFEEADLTLPEIKNMVFETASQAKGEIDVHAFESSTLPPQYDRLKSTWESFIDSVMREWKTFNIISVLLLSAILTILQIQGAADDPITRYTALSSLICALISLLFGCMYIIRFGGMRKTYKAAEWALEAKRTKTFIWWNVWVLLAMPAIWLTWSIILYIACIMSFVWRSSSQDDGPPVLISKAVLLTVRILITTVLGLGIIYGALILSTFSRYGEAMDRAWKKRIDGWIEEKMQMQYGPNAYSPYLDPMSYQAAPYEDRPYYRYPPPRQAFPPHTDPIHPAGDTAPNMGPKYSSASHVPLPEPYDPPAGSPQSTSSTPTDAITRSNTLHNLGLQRADNTSDATTYKFRSYEDWKPVPLPPESPTLTTAGPLRIARRKTLDATPFPSLSHIPLPVPERPATPVNDGNSTRNSSSSSGAIYDSGLGLDIGDGDDDFYDIQVRSPSPLVSAQGSLLAESEGNPGIPVPPNVDAPALSARLGSILDSVEPVHENDFPRRRPGDEEQV